MLVMAKYALPPYFILGVSETLNDDPSMRKGRRRNRYFCCALIARVPTMQVNVEAAIIWATTSIALRSSSTSSYVNEERNQETLY